MDVLGHEIDTSFIYKVTPCRIYLGEGRYDRYFFSFCLNFKDGGKHEVTLNHINYSNLNSDERKLFTKEKNSAKATIEKLRKNIVAEMNKNKRNEQTK